MPDQKEAATATINISDDTHRNFVEGAHNGRRFKIAVGKDVAVSEGTLTALQDSGVKLSIIKPLPGASAGEGLSADAASTEEGTAIRLESEADLDGPAAAGGEPATLSQVPDARTDAQKAELQSANADITDHGTGTPAPNADTSSAKPAKAAAAKPAARKTSAKRASTR